MAVRARRPQVRIVVPQRGEKRGLVDLANRNAALAYQTRFNQAHGRAVRRARDAAARARRCRRCRAASSASTSRRFRAARRSRRWWSAKTAGCGAASTGSSASGARSSGLEARADASSGSSAAAEPRAAAQRRLRGDARSRAAALPQAARAGRAVSRSDRSSTAARDSCRRRTRRSRSSASRISSRSASRRKKSCSTRAITTIRSRWPRNDPALLLIQRIRDEAHRFAVTFHRQARTMRDLRSELDDVPGVGPRRRRTLLTTFGSLAGVRRATREELAAVVGAESRRCRPCVFRESAVTCTLLAGHQLRADFHRVHRPAVFPDRARDGACVDGGSPRRSDGAAARPRLAQSDRARRSDRHGAVSADRDGQRRAADRLGEAGAGERAASAPSAARLHARRGGRAGEQSACSRSSRRSLLAVLPVSPHDARRAERLGADRGAAQPRDAAQRAARGVQHDSDSAARRRQRARRAAAAAARRVVQSAAAVRLPPALRADAHRRLRATSSCRRIGFILSWLP